jgi:hypothetical protein
MWWWCEHCQQQVSPLRGFAAPVEMTRVGGGFFAAPVEMTRVGGLRRSGRDDIFVGSG